MNEATKRGRKKSNNSFREIKMNEIKKTKMINGKDKLEGE